MRGFIWNDCSSTMYDVIVIEPPDVVTGVMRSETQKVIGSSKMLHYTEGPNAMDSVMVTLTCAIMKLRFINEFVEWMRGYGELTIPGDGFHYYRAFVKNQISMSRILRQFGPRRFTLQFECEPFRYIGPQAQLGKHAMLQVHGNPKAIYNAGSAPSEPLIRVEGNGAGVLTIGDTVFTFNMIDEYVMLDCEAQIAYKDNTNMGTHVTRQGDWPIVPPDKYPDNGRLTVAWSGGITGVKYVPRARDF